jgi:Ulp1 family protease
MDFLVCSLTSDKKEYSFKQVSRWHANKHLAPYLSKAKCTLFDFDIVMMPINASKHWVLLVADFREDTIHLLDSYKVRHCGIIQ